ncbi:MAG: hypothetical protein ABIO67_06590 [Mycobacteriales bacterium]
MLAAAAGTAGIPPIICTILLIATVIAFILGLLEVLGVYALGTERSGNSRFGTLVVALILLVVYVIAC